MALYFEISMCMLFCVFTAAENTVEYVFKRDPEMNNFLPVGNLLYHKQIRSTLSCNSVCVQNLKCLSVTIYENSCYFYSTRHHGNKTRKTGAVTFIMTTDTKLWYNGYTCKIELLWCYKYHDVNVIWTEAQDICETEGGNLLTIDTMEKQNIISTVTSTKGSLRYFTGINDIDKEGTFVDIHGNPIQFHFWEQGQPNGKTRQNCMGMSRLRPTWFDDKCEDPHGCICDIIIP